jgi:hypothetical protein
MGSLKIVTPSGFTNFDVISYLEWTAGLVLSHSLEQPHVGSRTEGTTSARQNDPNH